MRAVKFFIWIIQSLQHHFNHSNRDGAKRAAGYVDAGASVFVVGQAYV